MFSAVSNFHSVRGGEARQVSTVRLRVSSGSMQASRMAHTSDSEASCSSVRLANSPSLMPPEKSNNGGTAWQPSTMVGGARGCWGTRLMEPAGWKVPHSARHLGAAVRCLRSRPMEAKDLPHDLHTVSLGNMNAHER